MDTSAAVPFFLFALVPTGLLSFLFLWLLRGVVKPRLARALVANSLSLLALMVAVGFARPLTRPAGVGGGAGTGENE